MGSTESQADLHRGITLPTREVINSMNVGGAVAPAGHGFADTAFRTTFFAGSRASALTLSLPYSRLRAFAVG